MNHLLTTTMTEQLTNLQLLMFCIKLLNHETYSYDGILYKTYLQLMKHIHLPTRVIFISHRYLLSSSKTNLLHTH